MSTQNIGTALKLQRIKLDKTQVELAKEAGISRSHLAMIETGKYTPSIKTLCKIVKVLKMDFDFMNEML